MARCANCGRVNRDGSVFCQDCGHRLGLDEAAIPATRVKQPTPVAGVPKGTTCAACGTLNAIGMNFCKMCGTPIQMTPAPVAAPPAPPAPPAPAPAAVVSPPGAPGGLVPTPVGAPPAPRSPYAMPSGLPAPAAVARPVTPQPVAAPAPPSPQAVPVAQTRACTSCGGKTPVGFSFCQHCGARLPPPPVASGPAPAAARAGAMEEAVAATLAVPPGGSPAAEALAPTMASAGAAQVAAMHRPSSAPAAVAPPVTPRPFAPGPAAPVPAPAPAPMTPPSPVAAPATVRGGGVYGRLVSVHRDGSDGAVFTLTGETVTIGRTEGDLTFPDDRYLAWQHALIARRGDTVVLRALDPVNGVYARVREPTGLVDGDLFLLGKEVFRFELVDAAERDAAPAVQHGVLLFGSPPRAPWGRLRQLIVSGGTRDVLYLNKPEVVLGREDGDFRFPDDEFMSRRHASLSHQAGRVQLVDLGSSNGTYVRLRGERELRPGDLVRLGDQLLRFEPA